MSESRTSSMLQRVPVILAVTAASYGLQVPSHAMRWSTQGTQASATHKAADPGARASTAHRATPSGR